MAVQLNNTARGRLAAGIGSEETVITLEPGQAERFPEPVSGDWFPLVIENDAGLCEICRATARNGDAITVTRGAENTDRRVFSAGDRVELRITVAALDAFFEETAGSLESPGAAITPDSTVLLANLARATLARDLGQGAIDVYLSSGDSFPSPGDDGNEWFPLVLENAYGQIEICHAYWRSGAHVRVRRAREGTLPREWKTGDAAELRITVDALKAYRYGIGSEGPGEVFFWRFGYYGLQFSGTSEDFGYYSRISTVWESVDGSRFETYLGSGVDMLRAVSGEWKARYSQVVSGNTYNLHRIITGYAYSYPNIYACIPYQYIDWLSENNLDEVVSELNDDYEIRIEILKVTENASDYYNPTIETLITGLTGIFCRAGDLCMLLPGSNHKLFIVLNELEHNPAADKWADAEDSFSSWSVYSGAGFLSEPPIDNEMTFKGVWMRINPGDYGLVDDSYGGTYYHFAKVQVFHKSNGAEASAHMYISLKDLTTSYPAIDIYTCQV